MEIIFGFLFLVLHLAYGGEQSVQRIINGTDTKLGEFPYMAGLQRYDQDFYCGGVLVSAKHVLTVAHCAAPYSPENITVLLGTNDLLEGGVNYDVAEIILSDDSNSTNEALGIAILRLTREVEFTKNVSTVGLPTSDLSDGLVATLTGYGYQVKDPENGYMSQILQELPVKVVNQDLCAKQLQQYETIQPQDLCGYTAPNYGACYGDSGSPLVYNNTLFGLATSVHPDCAEGYPDVYARITYYLKFIRQIIL